ncbi:MAG: Copper binding protein plastocyanin/azurin family, partial [Fimbriimonadaceae bacterium]|nr:Copper binding protein plastocyanin/azurin family [Fimbriimonadaceae bacterium]
LVISNKGENVHDVVFDLPEGTAQLPSELHPSDKLQYEIAVPDKLGTYYFHCPVGDHYSRGMVGRIVVR